MKSTYKSPQLLKLCTASLSKKCVIVLSLCFSILSGCSTWQSQEDSPAAVAKAEPFLGDHWEIQSKIGFKTPDQSGSANMKWVQNGESYNILITDPLGRTLGQVKSNGFKVQFITKDKTVEANSADDVVFRLLGRPFPVSQLKYWIKGLKAPLLASQPISASDDELQFIQSQWFVKINDFQEQEGFRLPGKLDMVYPAPESKNLEDVPEAAFQLKISIKNWLLLPDEELDDTADQPLNKPSLNSTETSPQSNLPVNGQEVMERN